jgi:hypothetical protein
MLEEGEKKKLEKPLAGLEPALSRSLIEVLRLSH